MVLVVWLGDKMARSVLSESMIKIEDDGSSAREVKQSSRCLLVWLVGCSKKEISLLEGSRVRTGWSERGKKEREEKEGKEEKKNG